MRDIAATIQAKQDNLVRADLGGGRVWRISRDGCAGGGHQGDHRGFDRQVRPRQNTAHLPYLGALGSPWRSCLVAAWWSRKPTAITLRPWP
ncbi:hypothetical protein GCM10023205_03920 [Yinghuangia aomiensis]|uniref:Uncharacterized protein n=1 Tax=Yinghuangia aomiensis TaxID=676205 RepID=A0ABP9GLB9_9ACTN